MTESLVRPEPLRVSVLFLVFNRPEVTATVFEAIRQAKPPRLYVAADGPREGRLGEAERVARVREIATAVDWPCEVKTLFRGKNLGCKNAVSSAITWFFEQEEQGIILEDDCMPQPDFFVFCETLLERYRNDARVSVITGDNFQDGQWRGEASYYFSRYNHVWGWASWRRAWNHYNGELTFWPEWKNSTDWTNKLPDRIESKYWAKIFDRMYAKQIDTWDYPWTASVWFSGGLTATPNVNLVSNIGFGPDSTHTSNPNDANANRASAPLGQLIHPAEIRRDIDADSYTFDCAFGGKGQRFPASLLSFPRRVGGFVYRKIKGALCKRLL
jgi:hypothetical protein